MVATVGTGVTPVQEPDYQSQDLEVHNDMLIVESPSIIDPAVDFKYKYYGLITEKKPPPNKLFIKIEIGPAILRDGVICHAGKFYRVTKGDIQRGRFYVRNIIEQSSGSTSKTETKNSPKSRGQTSNKKSDTNQNKPGVIDIPGDKIEETADVVFKQQIRSLQYLQNTEEEWLF
jgi:hypothetical protein